MNDTHELADPKVDARGELICYEIFKGNLIATKRLGLEPNCRFFLTPVYSVNGADLSPQGFKKTCKMAELVDLYINENNSREPGRGEPYPVRNRSKENKELGYRPLDPDEKEQFKKILQSRAEKLYNLSFPAGQEEPSASGQPVANLTLLTQEEKVSVAVEGVIKLINDYDKFPTQDGVSIRDIRDILRHFQSDDFQFLYVALDALIATDNPVTSINFNSAGEIMSAARMDQCFGGVSPSMGDWYDNEIASCRSSAPVERVIDRVISNIRAIETDGKIK